LEERAKHAIEEDKARKGFGPLAQTEDGMCTIALSEFGDLMEPTGTRYCKEEHCKALKKLNKLGDKIHESDFVAQYIKWLWGGTMTRTRRNIMRATKMVQGAAGKITVKPWPKD
jgi:hypothetical protein